MRRTGDDFSVEPHQSDIEPQPDQRKRQEHRHAEPGQPLHCRLSVREGAARGQTPRHAGIGGRILEQGERSLIAH